MRFSGSSAQLGTGPSHYVIPAVVRVSHGPGISAFSLNILLWVQLAEPLTSQVIYPFINKLVGELPITGGDEGKIGYYAGLIAYITPSMISFGFSKSYSTLVISRCLSGVLNGNVGVVKSMMGELTDSTNIAQGMALMPVVWSSGATVGNAGKSLSYDQFPHTFGRFEFWKTYPYALPCFVIAFYCITSFFLALFYLKEAYLTLCRLRFLVADEHKDRQTTSAPGATAASQHLPLREVLTLRVIAAVSNYPLLALLDIALRALQPLFYTMPIRFGGLGFSPPLVGLCLGAFGLFSGIYQATIFAPIYNRFGTKRIFVTSVMTFIPMFLLFPFMNFSAIHGGINVITWTELTAQMILYVIMDMGFTAPSKHSLGATNGIAQTCISIVRAIGPVASTSLFSISLERNILDGYFVYLVMVILSASSLIATTFLPTTLWEVPDEDDEE
ncbi:MFS general substrate transporter [Favolaschia claudopus]|uniref:MFS general substrate transporter n=1 Tax=Favolaschia claudopus TaxID=2862362 RepID=A0AAW0DJQ1_9AGAR